MMDHMDGVAPTCQTGLYREINQLRKPSKDSNGEPKRKRYTVVEKYNEESCIGQFAQRKDFEMFTLGVISLNAIWIGIDTDWNRADDISTADTEYVVAENLFCFYFTFEIVVRFLAFKHKIDALKDHWFKFDFILVSFMILETWIMPLVASGEGGLSQLSILRLLRLLRLTRMVRLMRSVPELLTLIKGMIAATRSVGSALTLLIIFTYVFAIIFTGVYRELPPLPDEFDPDEMCEDVSFVDQDPLSEQCRRDALIGCFGDMPKSIFTLLVMGTLLDDLTYVAHALLGDSQLMLWVLILFILLSCFTVFNMLIGVLCEVIAATSEGERIMMAQTQLTEILRQAFEKIDVNKSGTVSRKEFDEMCANEEVLGAMADLEIEEKHVSQLAKVMFFDLEEDSGKIVEKELNFQEFMQTLLKFRPGQIASVLDLVDIRKHFHAGVATLEDNLARVESEYRESVPRSTPCVYCGKSPDTAPSRPGVVEAASSRELIEELARRFAAHDDNNQKSKSLCRLLRPAVDDDDV